MRVLILGGTGEANALAERLAGENAFEATLSLAGRTREPKLPPIPSRIGGFGGVDGLVDYLATERIDAVIDATHPFAHTMSCHAAEACARAGVPLAALARAPWLAKPGDDWREMDDADAAAAALGPVPQRVFLTVGRLSLSAFLAAPQHRYLVRTVDPLDDDFHGPTLCRIITARGPFALEAEIALMREERIEVVVSKNSGGAATYAKIAAARWLGLPVIMIRRPPPVGILPLGSPDAAMAWLRAHDATPA